jgi:hypothetical protein
MITHFYPPKTNIFLSQFNHAQLLGDGLNDLPTPAVEAHFAYVQLFSNASVGQPLLPIF